MASRFFINGGTNSNWSSTTNWSTSSGGTGGASVPTSGDDAYLDANSPACIVDATAACAQLLCTGYTHTLTMNAGLTATPASGGAVTFVGTMALAGASTLTLTAATSGTATFTSGGLGISVPLTIGGSSSTITLGDAWTVSGRLTLGTGTFGKVTINSFGFTVAGDFYMVDQFKGTSTYTLTGTSATWHWDVFGFAYVLNPITINTTGTITLTNVGAANAWQVNSLTVTAGTVAGSLIVTAASAGGGGGAYAFAG